MKYLLFLFSLFIFSIQLSAYEVHFEGGYLKYQDVKAILLHQQNGEVLLHRFVTKSDCRNGITIELADIFAIENLGVSLLYYKEANLDKGYRERVRGQTF